MSFTDISYLELWQPLSSVERNHLSNFSGIYPDWSCDRDQIGLFLKISLATGNHVIQFHLQHMGRWVTHLGVFSRPSHNTRKWQLCQKLACHNLGDSSFTAGVNRLSSWCGSSGPAEEHYLFMVPMLEHTAQVGREQAELLDCRKCLSW